MKKLLIVVLSCLLSAFTFGCSAVDDGEGKMLEDSQFLKDLAAGLEARWAQESEFYAQGQYERGSAEYTSLVDAELGHVRQYEKATLSDEKLTELAHEYVSGLLAEQSAAKAFNRDEPETIEDWMNAEDECTRILSIIVDDYKVPVSSDYKSDLEMIQEEGRTLQEERDVMIALGEIASKLGISFQENPEGGYIGRADILNSTQYDFAQVDFEVHFLDEEGEEYDNYLFTVSNWNTGNVVNEDMDLYFLLQMPARIEVTVGSYELAATSQDGTVSEPEVQYITSEGIVEPETGELAS